MKYVVVFDLDETLGYFRQINFLFHDIKNYINVNNHFLFKLIDLNPECLRPEILDILEFLKIKKKNNDCNNVMIYTNNQTSLEWVNSLKNYFNYKLNYNLIDKIVGAFKIGNKRIELLRTSHNKSYNDFLNSTKLPLNTEIFYLDDNVYKKMKNKKVMYINIEPYRYEIDNNILFNRLFNKFNELYSYKNIIIYNYTNNYEKIKLKEEIPYDIYEIASKQIKEFLITFFNKKNKYTLKLLKNLDYNKKTKKMYKNL